MNPFKLFFMRVFGLDPELLNVKDRTKKLAATLNGDAKWMLTCKPKINHVIECNDGNTYKKRD